MNDQTEPNFLFTDLFDVIKNRYLHPKPNSYTCKLFEKGEDEILKKIGEEAIEVILAAKAQGEKRIVEETSDLVYHLLVMLVYKGIDLSAILEELEKRHQ